MGQTFAKEKLFHDIDAGNITNTSYILEKYPNLVNKYLDAQQNVLPLTKAILNKNFEMFELLITFKADVNKKTANGYAPIFYACMRGDNRILQCLVEQHGCDIFVADSKGFTPLDIAIINGYYNCSLFLKRKGLRPKSIDFYALNKEKFVDYEIDFEWLVLNLEQENEFDDLTANKHIFVQKK